MEKVKLTKEGKKDLEDRLYELINVEIPEVTTKMGIAREQGDLSENHEYHAAREHLGRLMGEKEEIEERLKFCEIIEIGGSSSGKIQIGSCVTYYDTVDKEDYTFTIVGTVEANVAKGRISNESPIGQALLGNKVGDKVSIKTPKGDSYKIEIKEVV